MPDIWHRVKINQKIVNGRVVAFNYFINLCVHIRNKYCMNAVWLSAVFCNNVQVKNAKTKTKFH